MSAETAQDNDHMFAGTDQPQHDEEASRSWWVDLETREAFYAAQEREDARMRRSRTAAGLGSMIMGHTGRTR